MRTRTRPNPRSSEKPVLCVASHSHFDHMGGHWEFEHRIGHAAEALSLAHEQLQPEFFLEQLQLFAHPRLRRVQPFSSCSDVQPVVDNRKQIFQLL